MVVHLCNKVESSRGGATAEAVVEVAVNETIGMHVATEEGVVEATEAEAVVAAAGGRVAGNPAARVSLLSEISAVGRGVYHA